MKGLAYSFFFLVRPRKRLILNPPLPPGFLKGDKGGAKLPKNQLMGGAIFVKLFIFPPIFFSSFSEFFLFFNFLTNHF